MNSKLFRQVAIERLSSPEQLDQILRVTNFRTWISLTALIAVLSAATMWGFEGAVVSTTNGQGVIVRRGGVLNVVARGSGIIMDLRVKPGDKIKANQIVASIAQPEQVEKVRAMRSAVEEARRSRVETSQMQQQAAKLQQLALDQQRTHTELEIRHLEEREKVTEKQITAEEQLLAKGLITHQQVITVEQTLADIRGQLENQHAQLKQYDSQAFAIASGPVQGDLAGSTSLAALERDLVAAEKDLEMSENVISPFTGEVLESKVYPGGTVASGQPLFSVQPDEETLELVAYLPSAQAKDAARGSEVQISPLNIKREEYGFMRGQVSYVADYPSTPEALLRNFENQSLVQVLSQAGPVTEVRASIRVNRHTASGFEWSTSLGPDMKITGGTMCAVRIVTRRQAPVSLLFPYLRRKVGLS